MKNGFSIDDGIFTFNVGQITVYMLVERQNPGKPEILAGADEATLKKYIPAEGFMHTCNTFLIKTHGKHVLVDTGFGGAVFDKMKILGVEPELIDAVLITHLHGDHIGGLQKDGKALFPNANVLLSSKELDYFTNINVNQNAVNAIEPYKERIAVFEPSELDSDYIEFIPGIVPIANYGHTPGHTVYLVENNNEKLIIAGDFLHIALVQFAEPDISATYDMDQKMAAISRRQLLEYAVKNKVHIGGIHILYPGIGSVEKEGKGFKLKPAG
jgi:glyoxylase-like metal-dependent hydrolase (beta-lactamase superfamily II)